MPFDEILVDTMLPAIGHELLERQSSDGERTSRIAITAADDGFACEMS